MRIRRYTTRLIFICLFSSFVSAGAFDLSSASGYTQSFLEHASAIKAELVHLYGYAATFLGFESEEDKWATAYHEAGHALIAVLTGRRVYGVTIQPPGKNLGNTRIGMRSTTDGPKVFGNKSEMDLCHEVMIYLGGLCGQEVFCSDISCGCDDDLARAAESVDKLVAHGGQQFDEVLELCKSAARQLLSEYRQEHEMLAHVLFEKKELGEQEIYGVVGAPRDAASSFIVSRESS